MATVTVKFGVGNTISREANSTSEVLRDSILMQIFGADPANLETVVNGAVYDGALFDGDIVDLRTKAHKKNS